MDIDYAQHDMNNGLVVSRRNPMSGILTNFRIEALHNRYTIDMPIEDNRLILIGENGTGKSTFANFVYFFLTNQWDRMLAYDFKAVQAIIDSKEIEIPREKLAENQYKQVAPTWKITTINALATTRKFSEDTFTPLVFREFLETFMRELAAPFMSLEAATLTLKDAFKERVLYLPTYRRIEQDLASISSELASSSGSRAAMEQWKQRAQTSQYIELVQFGMQDVEDTIKRTMDELGNSLIKGSNNLINTYLRDVLRGIDEPVESEEIDQLDETAISAIFNRIDPSVLPEPEQQKLRGIVSKIKDDRRILDDDQAIVRFLIRLIELYKSQQEKERDIQKFVSVCNQYLQDKEFTYDSTRVDLSLLQHNDFNPSAEKRLLKMNMLSSGEKQIVSLFSQIYLSGTPNYFVIIDEPELSLSVFWQKRLLPDILNSGRCSGLIAATHSPFICENELVEKYTRPLEQFMRPLA